MSNRDNFVKCYNYFDGRPLFGQTLIDFYVDDFCKTSVKEITTTVEISEQYRKMLLIGHRGCGKSTILNKVAKVLYDKYFIVSFSASEELNMHDVEPVDILLAAYLKLLKSLDENWLIRILKKDKTIKKFIDFINLPLELEVNTMGIELFKTISFKFKVEDESRAQIRRQLHGQIKELLDNINSVCRTIEEDKKKTVLIIIDDLDKLQTVFSEKIFFENQFLLTLPEVKVIYTFPLDTYYSDFYVRISDRYDDQFIPLVNLKNKEGQKIQVNTTYLCNLINQRIDSDLVTQEALNFLIDKSGGLLRDLVKFMQDGCKLAIVEEKEAIDLDIAKKVVSKYINDYYRVFDSSIYKDAIKIIADSKEKDGNTNLIYFLHHLFALEYRQDNQLWYDVHPCLKSALEIKLT